MLPFIRLFVTLFAFMVFIPTVPLSYAEDDVDADDVDVVPLRLSYASGQVSFWRYGAEDWVGARINTPLAQGDALYVGRNSRLELQIDSQDFIRAEEDAQISVVDQSRNFLQLKIPAGRVSFDLRNLPDKYSIEIDTPNSVFTVENSGYYRLEVGDEVRFVTRRGGRASIVPSGGEAMSILPAEEVIVRGTDMAQVVANAAPDLDAWDNWNYQRTEDLMAAQSERYLPSGVAGAAELDRYGSWRNVDEYGSVWEPNDVPPGWAPYTQGNWVWDPYYQWTWIDEAPWGWAPFHYGRWVNVDGRWMWAPGMVEVRRPAYAPAVVGFLGSSVSLGWVALGWGEPICPWWGRPGFVGRPWWGGWHGPRHHWQDRNITFANRHFRNAVITAPRDRFGHGRFRDMTAASQRSQLTPIQGALPVKPDPVSVVAGASRSVSPPQNILGRPVIAVHRPPETRLPWRVVQQPGAVPGTAGRVTVVPQSPSNTAQKFAPQQQAQPQTAPNTTTSQSANTDTTAPTANRATRQDPNKPNWRIVQQPGGHFIVMPQGNARQQPAAQQPSAPQAGKRDLTNQAAPPRPVPPTAPTTSGNSDTAPAASTNVQDERDSTSIPRSRTTSPVLRPPLQNSEPATSAISPIPGQRRPGQIWPPQPSRTPRIVQPGNPPAASPPPAHEAQEVNKLPPPGAGSGPASREAPTSREDRRPTPQAAPPVPRPLSPPTPREPSRMAPPAMQSAPTIVPPAIAREPAPVISAPGNRPRMQEPPAFENRTRERMDRPERPSPAPAQSNRGQHRGQFQNQQRAP